MKKLINQNFKIFMILFSVCVFTLGYSPCNAQLQDMRNRLKNKAKKKIRKKEQPKLEDQGITGEVHGKYVGQIVWSNEEITAASPDESKFKKKFTINDYIFGRFYLKESVQNTIYQSTVEEINEIPCYYRFFVDGKLYDWKEDPFLFTGRSLPWTHRKVLLNVPSNMKRGDDGVEWSKLVNSLEPGEHEIKITVHCNKVPHEILATGNFAFVKKAGEVVKIGSLENEKAGALDNEELRAEILKAINDHSNRNHWKYEGFFKVKVISDNWTILTNRNSGVITGRSVEAYCLLKEEDGTCSIAPYIFAQQYTGNGYTKNVYYYTKGDAPYKAVDCE